ncbi:DNA polymerase III subunit delta [Eubacteriaceae bacterium ES3]|nr:DNA polymerase III subunit delta [Eubacteriaceae bacterium ES3]
MNYKNILQNIKTNKLDPVYLFTGTEKYLSEIIEQKIIKSAISVGMEGVNITVYSEKTIDFSEVIANCETLPLLSDRRVIILQNSLDISKISSKNSELLLNYIEKPLDSTILIIHWEKPDKRKKIFKSFEKYATIADFSKLNQTELNDWISDKLKSKKKKMEKNIMESFIDRSMYLTNEAATLESIDHFIDQLCDFIGEKDLFTQDDLLQVLPESIEEGIFRLIDYAMSGDKGNALLMLGQFYLEGESPFGVFSLLLRQIRQLIQVKAYGQKLKKPNLIAKEMKISVYVVNKILKNARKYSVNQLLELLSTGADYDYQMKTGEIEQNMALELFILKM